MTASAREFVAAFGSELHDPVLSPIWAHLNLGELESTLPSYRPGSPRRTINARYGKLGMGNYRHWYATTTDERAYACVRALLTPLYSALAEVCAASGPEAGTVLVERIKTVIQNAVKRMEGWTPPAQPALAPGSVTANPQAPAPSNGPPSSAPKVAAAIAMSQAFPTQLASNVAAATGLHALPSVARHVPLQPPAGDHGRQQQRRGLQPTSRT